MGVLKSVKLALSVITYKYSVRDVLFDVNYWSWVAKLWYRLNKFKWSQRSLALRFNVYEVALWCYKLTACNKNRAYCKSVAICHRNINSTVSYLQIFYKKIADLLLQHNSCLQQIAIKRIAGLMISRYLCSMKQMHSRDQALTHVSIIIINK